jgi:hypothetical protein
VTIPASPYSLEGRSFFVPSAGSTKTCHVPAGPLYAEAIVMKDQWIDFIHAYCDGWCERCAFTQRCSHFAVTSAVGMCDGDFRAALELTFGSPRVPGRPGQATLEHRIAETMADFDPTDKELDEIGRELDARRSRIEKAPIAEASMDYAVATRRWCEAHDNGAESREPAIADALEVIRWDSHLIHVKIMRALDGRDEYPDGDLFDRGPIQSDWNGSAKVALLSIERSGASWRAVAGATGDEAAAALADTLASLGVAVLQQFPRAREFRRPGFDD